jgi:hypothetical protein
MLAEISFVTGVRAIGVEVENVTDAYAQATLNGAASVLSPIRCVSCYAFA